MAKARKPKKREAGQQIKTKTKKQKRSGIYAKAHHSLPVIRLQTPVNPKAPFEGMTEMRRAFEAIAAGPRPTGLARRILRRMALPRRGRYTTGGWRVLKGE